MSNPRLIFVGEHFCKLFFSLYCPLKITGRENLPPPPYILCSNHCSHLDAPALIIASGLSFDRFGIMAAKDYFFDSSQNRRWLSSFFQLLPLDRKVSPESIARSLSLCQQFCQETHRNLIIFPEGTRSKTGNMQPFKNGAALLASKLGFPLIPAYIQNSFASWPKGQRFPRPKTIHISFGKPIPITSSYRDITSELENQIQSLRTHLNKI